MESANKRANISRIASLRLCNSCGACQFVCPKHAIQYEETIGGFLIPRVDADLCIECGLCSSVCPGAGLSKQVLEALPADPFAGYAIATYVGKSANKQIFDNSQSGGIVSALLCCALEATGMHGALTVIMEPGSPPRPKTQLAKTPFEIIRAQKSKYCPVPLLSSLEEVMRSPGPVALVGIPCQIHGLKNIFTRFPKLEDKIGVVIGLFCDRIMSYAAIDYFLKKAEYESQEEVNILFRDKNIQGYPGDVHIIARDKSVVLPKGTRFAIKDNFTPARCRLCFDKFNIFSDISVGDPWGIEDVDRHRGESVAVVRTSKGKRLFEQAVDKGYIRVREISYLEVVNGQRIDLKRRQWAGFTDAWEKLNFPLPNFHGAVASHAGPPTQGDYSKLLKQALALDSFKSRDNLISHIIRKKHISIILNILRRPDRLAKKAVKYFIRRFR